MNKPPVSPDSKYNIVKGKYKDFSLSLDEFKPFFELADKLDQMSFSELLDLIGDRIQVLDWIDENRCVIRDRRRRPGFITVSDLESYLYCARKLWLLLHHGQITDKNGLKFLARGILCHESWSKYAKGATEFEVKSYEFGIIGHIDELRYTSQGLLVIELKTSWKPADYHKLKLWTYMFLVKNEFKMNDVYGALVYRRGILFLTSNDDFVLTYLKRARKVLYSNTPPPSLPKQFKHRCNYCAYRDLCKKYPDEQTWSEWLLEFMPEKCQSCPYNKFCKEFKATIGVPPCEASKSILTKYMDELYKGERSA